MFLSFPCVLILKFLSLVFLGVFRVTARTADGEIMAVEHTDFPVFGVQFHPESILTPRGSLMLENFLRIS